MDACSGVRKTRFNGRGARLQVADFKQRLGRAKKQVLGLKRQLADAQQQRDAALDQLAGRTAASGAAEAAGRPAAADAISDGAAAAAAAAAEAERLHHAADELQAKVASMADFSLQALLAMRSSDVLGCSCDPSKQCIEVFRFWQHRLRSLNDEVMPNARTWHAIGHQRRCPLARAIEVRWPKNIDD